MIEAKIIADSGSEVGDRITTFELTYPRFIHSELMTHRMFSRNAASSRAIPVDKILSMIEEGPAIPEEWGKNQSGMQAKEIFTEDKDINTAQFLWRDAAKTAVWYARKLQEFGLHKQIVNRVVEPFVHMKTIVTATEYDNFFWLRCHPDAQPEIRILAEKMEAAFCKSKPMKLKNGEWHTPYVDHMREENGTLVYNTQFTTDGYGYGYIDLTLDQALKVSASCCAQVSFRNNDDSLDKAIKIYDRLVNSKPIHASPFEHQATPIDQEFECDLGMGGESMLKYFPEGITHLDRDGELWSGNFKGWIQHRQLIPNHDCKNYFI